MNDQDVKIAREACVVAEAAESQAKQAHEQALADEEKARQFVDVDPSDAVIEARVRAGVKVESAARLLKAATKAAAEARATVDAAERADARARYDVLRAEAEGWAEACRPELDELIALERKAYVIVGGKIVPRILDAQRAFDECAALEDRLGMVGGDRLTARSRKPSDVDAAYLARVGITLARQEEERLEIDGWLRGEPRPQHGDNPESPKDLAAAKADFAEAAAIFGGAR